MLTTRSGLACRVAQGVLVSITSGPRALLAKPLALNFWRPPTDNDYGWGLPKILGAWKSPQLVLVSSKPQAPGAAQSRGTFNKKY